MSPALPKRLAGTAAADVKSALREPETKTLLF